MSCIAIDVDVFSGASTSNPSTILGASLALWLESGVSMSGSSWADQSGNGRNSVQATPALQPTTGTLDGKPALVFDGTKAMSMPLNFSAGAKAAYLVFQMSATPGGGGFYSAIAMNTAAAITELILSNIGGAYTPITFVGDMTGLVNGVGYSPTLDTSKHILGFSYNGGLSSTPGNYTSTYDSAAQSVVASSALLPTLTNLSSIGGRLSSANAITDGFVGSIAEVIVASIVPSAPQNTAILAYLTSKFP